MNVFLTLFWEFFKTGLFAVGGGMATLPFLQDIGEKTGWYTYTDLMNMLAVSESTPGPIGINMATFVGFTVAGVPGAIVATVGEITPSIVVILIIAMVLNKFRDSKLVNNAFYGLRPASTGLIGAAGTAVIFEVLTSVRIVPSGVPLINTLTLGGGDIIKLNCIILGAILLILTNWVKPTKKLHPIVFILISAVVGIVFKF